MRQFLRLASLHAAVFLTCFGGTSSSAIDIVLDYTLDERNENWFDPLSSVGMARRAAVDSAAEFLSEIIVNDDWASLLQLDEAITFTDIAASTIFDLSGNTLVGQAESDGQGYSYSSTFNDVHTTNRSSVGANEYIVYVGAFAFDAGATANAKASWDSNDRRNAAGEAGVEFNTWGGKVYFNTAKSWYVGTPPGIDPTGDYGFQDPNKQPASDISTDNWEWSTSSDSWKGFDLLSVDPTAAGMTDLYGTALHEMMHVLGATTSIIEDYVGVDTNGDFISTNLVATYGGPVPGDGGHFAENIQSFVWSSEDIISEGLLDPNSRAGVRKYLTQLDAALLRDLGYSVLTEFVSSVLPGDYNEDGVVNLTDYTVWRDQIGASEGTLANDTVGGVIDTDQYDAWRSNFGATLPAAAEASKVAVPEPNALVLLGLCGNALLCPRRARFALPRPRRTLGVEQFPGR
jgi:hypothetical protein